MSPGRRAGAARAPRNEQQVLTLVGISSSVEAIPTRMGLPYSR